MAIDDSLTSGLVAWEKRGAAPGTAGNPMSAAYTDDDDDDAASNATVQAVLAVPTHANLPPQNPQRPATDPALVVSLKDIDNKLVGKCPVKVTHGYDCLGRPKGLCPFPNICCKYTNYQRVIQHVRVDVSLRLNLLPIPSANVLEMQN